MWTFPVCVVLLTVMALPVILCAAFAPRLGFSLSVTMVGSADGDDAGNGEVACPTIGFEP